MMAGAGAPILGMMVRVVMVMIHHIAVPSGKALTRAPIRVRLTCAAHAQPCMEAAAAERHHGDHEDREQEPNWAASQRHATEDYIGPNTGG